MPQPYLGQACDIPWWCTAGQKRTICEGCKTGSGVIPGPGFGDGTLMTSTCVQEVHRVVHQHGTRAEEEHQGLLGPEIPTTVCSLLPRVMPLYKFSMFSRLLHVGDTNAPTKKAARV